jgi:hypothetical protein
MKRIFIVITILVLTTAVAVALGADHRQTALAQAPNPPVVPERGAGGTAPQVQPWVNNLPGELVEGGEVQALPTGQMSYQGKLEIDGSPASGAIDLTFRLYFVEIGGTSIWTETQTVNCDNGLFSVMLGAVEPLPYAVYFQSQVWLGVQPDGAASELTPRQMLGTVGYAMNLMPGATMVDTNPAGGYSFSLWVHSYEHLGIYASSDITDGVGVYGYAGGPWSGGVDRPTGVYGSSNYTGTIGVNGYSYGYDSLGVYGVANGDTGSCPIGDYYCGAGVLANSFGDSYGSFAYGEMRSGVIGLTDSGFYASAFYNFDGSASPGLYVDGTTYLNGYLTVAAGKSGYVVDVALNAGSEPLERGDVVVIVGMDAPVVGQIPVIRVQKATPETASGIVGVVDVLFETCTKSQEELELGEACGGYVPSVTSIQPGQHLGVVTLGAFQWLKADATGAPIKAGDLLSISPSAGVAAKAQMITIDGYSFYAPGTIIGKALQDLESGSGVIAVFVSLK